MYKIFKLKPWTKLTSQVKSYLRKLTSEIKHHPDVEKITSWIKADPKVSLFNKLVILSIISLFAILFYLLTPALYDYGSLQKQLKLHLLNEFNLNINVSNNIQYKILPSPHFDIKNSVIYSDTKFNKNKLGELKNLKLYISSKNLHDQKKIKLKSIEIKNSLFFLNEENKKFLFFYFNNKNFNKNLIIRKSKFFLKNKDNIISIFPIKSINLRYNKKLFINEVFINGIAFNSDFNLNVKKKFQDNKSLNFGLKFPKINLSIENTLLSLNDTDQKYKAYSIINFFGAEIKSEFDIYENSLDYKSNKSIVFNNQVDFYGSIAFKPFYLKSNIILNQINLIKILNNNSLFFKIIDKENFIHKNLNSNISLDIKNFSKDNIFNKAKIFIETQDGLIKFDNTLFISEKFGYLKILNSNFYKKNKELFLKSNIFLNIHNKKNFYNIFQIQKKYRKDLRNINFEVEFNLTSGKIKITKFQMNNNTSNDLADKINNVISFSNIDVNKNLNNWIVLKRLLNTVIAEINLG